MTRQNSTVRGGGSMLITQTSMHYHTVHLWKLYIWGTQTTSWEVYIGEDCATRPDTEYEYVAIISLHRAHHKPVIRGDLYWWNYREISLPARHYCRFDKESKNLPNPVTGAPKVFTVLQRNTIAVSLFDSTNSKSNPLSVFSKKKMHISWGIYFKIMAIVE